MRLGALVLLAPVLLAPVLALAGAPVHFDLEATFVPASKAGTEAAVAVFFTARDPNVRINENPAPRLRLDPDQKVLLDKQEAVHSDAPPPDLSQARYLDLSAPVRFPVALAPGVAKGQQTVKAAVTYFYCSKTAGWCRKGTTDVEVPVVVK